MLYPKEGRMDMRPAPILKAHGKRSKMNTFNVVMRDASALNQSANFNSIVHRLLLLTFSNIAMTYNVIYKIGEGN